MFEDYLLSLNLRYSDSWVHWQSISGNTKV